MCCRARHTQVAAAVPCWCLPPRRLELNRTDVAIRVAVMAASAIDTPLADLIPGCAEPSDVSARIYQRLSDSSGTWALPGWPLSTRAPNLASTLSRSCGLP